MDLLARASDANSIPVICCGAITLGGAGKTTLVQDFARRIAGAHILTRGYGSYSNSVRRVVLSDSYASVGDEALLHARIAPTWRSSDRAIAARLAFHAGAKALVLDDGLQNQSISRTLSVLVVDGAHGFGNGRVVPFGPLREPINHAVNKADVAVIVGSDKYDVAHLLRDKLPLLRAHPAQMIPAELRARGPFLAFAAIAFPERFFAALRQSGLAVVETKRFPNHYPYSLGDLADLVSLAKANSATLVTTPKDAVRLPVEFVRSHIEVAEVGLLWEMDEHVERKLIACWPTSAVATPVKW